MDSLIGDVPDGWTACGLGDVGDLLAGPAGARLPLEPRTASNVPVVAPRELRHNRIDEDDGSAVPREVADELAGYRLRPGDIVCSRTGDLGRQALVGEKEEGWLIGSACFRLRVHGSVDAAFLTYYLGHPAVRDWVVRNATGSAIPSMNMKTLSALPVVLPSREIQKAMAEVLGSLDAKIVLHDRISRTTAELRDSLLPVLLQRGPGRG
ncbi:restriction endonuclease subunit S [Pseudonocardia acaciae]|uniref:restriction endonuclease subunit S n=1 Tax=Pseudonocardia acaciae TaxID=551276 RepID=UPI00048C43AB|nr:restriction endonuclease subunit S [Pseudonocardia acaciae]